MFSRILICVVPVALMLGCQAVGPDVVQYRGDGTFRDTGWWFYAKHIRGFAVSFPEFSLMKEHRARYFTGNLSSLESNNPTIGVELIVQLENRDEANRCVMDSIKRSIRPGGDMNSIPCDGTLRVTLQNQAGETVLTWNEPLRAMGASKANDISGDCVALGSYKFGLAVPKNVAGECYLTVEYVPGARAFDRPAYLRFVSGGTK